MPTEPIPATHAATAADAITRRGAIATLGFLGAAALAPAARASQRAQESPARRADQQPVRPAQHTGFIGWDDAKNEYALPPLAYTPDALEPHIDSETMQIHYNRHHASYVSGANKALAELAKIRNGDGDAALVKHWSRELSFNASGHVNHTLFWLTMAPPDQGGGGEPSGALADQINQNFGSFAAFTKHFLAAANAVEGSGWGWLVWEPVSRTLQVLQGEKQQNLTIWGVTPLLGVDVWEHAYYLKYQNRRSDYTKAFMNVVNWNAVANLFTAARI